LPLLLGAASCRATGENSPRGSPDERGTKTPEERTAQMTLDLTKLLVPRMIDLIADALPKEMANTKINPAYDKYHIGFNDAVKQMREALGLVEEREDGE
jgi:hypothetical protein